MDTVLGTTMAFRKSGVQACPCLSWNSYFDTTSHPHAELRTMALPRNQPPGSSNHPGTPPASLSPVRTMEPQVLKARRPGDRRQAGRQCDRTFPSGTPDSASVWPRHLWERIIPPLLQAGSAALTFCHVQWVGKEEVQMCMPAQHQSCIRAFSNTHEKHITFVEEGLWFNG